MQRVVSVFLPTWPTDRLRRSNAAVPPDGPLVTALTDGRRRVIGDACPQARAAGLRPGMPLAQAQARVEDLIVVEADPAADLAALQRLAGWALRYAPLVAPDPPDGFWLDITGCAHLWSRAQDGGEPMLLEDLRGRLHRAGIAARAAAADTPGAAHALARHGAAPLTVATGPLSPWLDPLPAAALRLAPDTLDALHRVGLERIGQLAAAPRAPLVRRFGPSLAERLDQAFGAIAEPITPQPPTAAIAHRLAFPEPLLTADAFAAVIGELTRAVCAALERAGQGARRLDLLFERVDGSWQAVRIGTARPARNPRHLARLLTERLDTVDPGLGIEAMHLVVTQAEALAYAQGSLSAGIAGDDRPAVAELVDRLAGRLGEAAVYRAAPVESRVPERAVRRIGPLDPPVGVTWPATLPRPARLLDPPVPVDVLALLPDHPPAAFTWRRVRHRVRRADGPERVHGEWWRGQQDAEADGARVRDYFVVEDSSGRRFWLFRRGDGVDPASGDGQWYLHGLL